MGCMIHRRWNHIYTPAAALVLPEFENAPKTGIPHLPPSGASMELMGAVPKKKTTKRFFQSIENEGSKQKPSLSASKCSQEAEAKAEDERKEATPEESSKEPLKFLMWNANSFLFRAKNSWPELSKLVEKLDPDVIAIQVSPYRKGLRNGPKALKLIPVIIRCKSCGRVKLPHFYCCSGD